MKFIVKSDFYRTPSLADIEIVGVATLPESAVVDGKRLALSKEPPHANHFHAGAIIEIGKSENESELQTSRKDSNETKTLIATLRYAGRIGDASDKEVVKRVVEEIVIAKKHEANEAKAAAQTDNTKLLDVINALIAKAAGQVAAK